MTFVWLSHVFLTESDSHGEETKKTKRELRE